MDGVFWPSVSNSLWIPGCWAQPLGESVRRPVSSTARMSCACSHPGCKLAARHMGQIMPVDVMAWSCTHFPAHAPAGWTGKRGKHQPWCALMSVTLRLMIHRWCNLTQSSLQHGKARSACFLPGLQIHWRHADAFISTMAEYFSRAQIYMRSGAFEGCSPISQHE